MSRRRAALRREQRGQAARRIDTHYAVVAGWAGDAEDLEEAKRGTHDALLRLLGGDRIGGVQWRIFDGAAASQTVSLLMDGVTDQALSDHYRKLAGLLREFGGFLVVAIAPGRIGAPT